MLRRISMLSFLGLFTLLLIAGRLQLWMVIIGISVLSALIFGRFFCGWICPINTFIEMGTWLKRKFKLNDNTPQYLKRPAFGYILLLILVAGFVTSRITGRNIPLLLFFIPVGGVIAFTFSPATWHHWLCPYNVLFKLTGGRSVFSRIVNPMECNGCTLCQIVCPADAIWIENRKASIDKAYCLECTACQVKCPVNAISYGRATNQQEQKQTG